MADFTDAQQSAYDLMADLLNQYNLGSLAPALRAIVSGGVTDENEIALQLQSTNEWKQRFAGNEALRAAGRPVLSVAEYLATERSYAQILKNYGLPTGFYDDPADFAQFIGTDVSPNELQQRAQMYADVAQREDPAIVAQLQAMGMTKGDILAHMMDPQRALPLLAKKYQAAVTGAAARRAGLAPSAGMADHMADLGVTEQQASAAYGQIATELPTASLLGSIYKDAINQSDLEREQFDGDGSVSNKKRRLASRERAAFSGSSGAGQGSLNRGSAGSY